MVHTPGDFLFNIWLPAFIKKDRLNSAHDSDTQLLLL